MFRKLLAAVGVISTVACAPPAEAQITPRPEVLTGAFNPGFVGEADEERYPMRSVRLGSLNLSSGRLVLADPFMVSARDEPLDLPLPPGHYPVDVAVADAGESGQRVALARLLIADRPPVRWALAVTAGQDVRSLRGDEIFSYGVDAGTGAFIDSGALAWLAREYPPARTEAYAALLDDWQTRGEAAAEPLGIPYGFALVEDLGPGGVAMFSSGWGDGAYASWVGYDAEDRPVVVVTDFAVITAVNFPPAANPR